MTTVQCTTTRTWFSKNSLFQNGKWNGLMAALVNKKTDMVLSSLKVSFNQTDMVLSSLKVSFNQTEMVLS
jgi:hypothetical protein